jgi:hypothetical protein
MISGIWNRFMKERSETLSDFPSHFPLSVIFHFIQTEADDSFITDKLLPQLCTLILESLEFIGVETNVESTPVQRIRSETPPESTLHLTVTKAWWAVCQSLNIISSSVNRFFGRIATDTVRQLGDTLFRFLGESRHYSSVTHAQQTFQALCTRCWTRDDCVGFPRDWCERLVATAGSWTTADHRSSNGFVQTALALIRSEPSHLFGSQRTIYDSLLNLCRTCLPGPSSSDELRSALLLIEAIACDLVTQGNFEPYSAQLLMQVLNLLCHPMGIELGNVAKRTLASLLVRQWKHKDLRRVSNAEFFQVNPVLLDFFYEHLVPEDSEISFVVLQIIQRMAPFSDNSLLTKVVDMRKSRYSRVRRAASSALLVVLPSERVDAFVRKCLRDLRLVPAPPARPGRVEPEPDPIPDSNEPETLDDLEFLVPTVEQEEEESLDESSEDLNANTCDGIILQIQQLVRQFPQVKATFSAEIESLCDRFIGQDSGSLIQIYVMIQLAREWDCLQRLKPLLLHLFRNRRSLTQYPLGHHFLRASLSVLDEPEVVRLLQSNDDATILHLLLQLKKLSPVVSSVCIDLFLRSKNEAITGQLAELLRKNPIKPSEPQRARFEHVLFRMQDDSRTESMLCLAAVFEINPVEIFRHFERYSLFVDRSDSKILLFLSNLALRFHQELFSSFDEGDFSHWKVALRIVSDENPAVRFPCCQALSIHLNATGIDPKLQLCEFDVIVQIYESNAKVAARMLKGMLTELRRVKENGGESTLARKEPATFLYPPSFHIDCIKRNVQGEKV